tara:strand:+ start:607 stop:744 length:138 start_codon:yes stop_codon:yes gene_type:complete
MYSFFFSTFVVPSFEPSAAIVGVLSIVLFVAVGFIAGPNLSKFDS